MATRKQVQKTFEELDGLKNELINQIFPEIKSTKEKLDQYISTLFVDHENEASIKSQIEELQNKTIALKALADEKVAKILEFHKNVFEGDEENDSLKDNLENYLNESEDLFKETEKKKIDFDTFYKKVFGEKSEEGVLVGGLKNELEVYEVRYRELFDKIESLLPGATSAGLAKVFGDKVSEYKKTETLWTWISFGLLSLLSIYYAFTLPTDVIDIQGITLHLLERLPFIIFAIWLVIFAGNRRAESKKLEESYKHKEVMARAFVGYKEQIIELDENDSDKELLKSHMSNLLEAININSGDFLDNHGDKSPLYETLDVAKDLLNKKINIPGISGE